MIDANRQQHERLVKVLNARKYDFQASRKGYCRPHVSEVRMYNIRAKKEIMPFVLMDIGASPIMPAKKIRLWDVIKGPKKSEKDAFFDGRLKLVAGYLMQKLGKVIRIKPAELTKERDQIPLIPGWFYAHAIGSIDDIDRGWGEEL